MTIDATKVDENSNDARFQWKQGDIILVGESKKSFEDQRYEQVFSNLKYVPNQPRIPAGSGAGGEFASTSGGGAGVGGVAPKDMAPEDYANHLRNLTEAQRDNVEFNENSAGYALYEAQNLMPKQEGEKFKKLTDNNSAVLNRDAEYVANVGGKPWILSRWEDPDATDDFPKVFVYAYASARNLSKFVETSTMDNSEVLKEMKQAVW